MGYCPKDMKPCIDDLCHGGGCLEMEGAPMYYRCNGCGKLVSEDDTDLCECEPEDYYA